MLLAATLFAGPPPGGDSLQGLYEQGIGAAKSKDFAGAERVLRGGLDTAVAAADKSWALRFAHALGELYQAQQRLKDASTEYGRALTLCEELGRQQEINPLLMRLGSIYATLGDYAKATGYLDRAQAGFLESSDNAAAAGALDVLGQLQARLGRFADAERSLGKASSLYANLADGRRLAKVRGSLADLYFRRSAYAAALENGFQALDEDEHYADWREAAKVLDVLGNTFQRMGQAESGLRYYRRALTLREQHDVKQDLRFSYRNIGAALTEMGRHAEALEYYGKSLDLGKAAGSDREVAASNINIGTSELALGRMDAARRSYEQALAIARRHEYRPEEAMALSQLGNLSLDARDLDHALENHRRALAIREEIKDRREVVFSLNRLGVVLEKRGDLKGAAEVHERALGEFERIGAAIPDPVQYSAYRRTSVVLYPHYARVLVKLGRTRDALLVSERSRGVGLARLTALNGANFADLLKPADAEAWRGVTARLGRAANALRVWEEKAGGEAGPPPETVRKRDQARALYLETELELTRLRERLFAATPRLREGQRAEAPELAQLEALVKASPQTLFLEWMMVEEKSALLFAVAADGWRAYLLPVGTAEIKAAADAWRTSLTGAPDKTPAKTREGEAQLARKLYRMVFAPVDPLLAARKYTRLVLAPEGPLLDIPFAALMDAKGDRVIDRYAISNTICLNYLDLKPNRPKPVHSLLAVADPLAAGEQRVVVPSGDRYEPLTEAQSEAETVAAMYPGSVTLSGPHAREAEIKRRLPEFEFLHFATHGILDRSDGLRSGLLLATEAADGVEDGLLQGWEIAGLSLSARMAVLSACETGRGNERLGEGLIGLAWAFHAAGCPRIVASLWKVDDMATTALITEFYKELGSGKRVDDAMRGAILQLRKDARRASPYYWAAFAILGHAGALQ
jgi:CHAT domain-containing protein/Tfp pilus assembly protein PilF